MSKPVSTSFTIGVRSFRDRRMAREHVGQIRAKWLNKGPIRGKTHDFVMALFQYHPDASIKAPNGVSHFVVDLAPRVEGRALSACFYVVGLDGAKTEFSANTALRSAYQSQQAQPQTRASTTDDILVS